MNGEWWSWLAGLLDGEGTFVIEPNGTLRMRISLTESDVETLRGVQKALGFGSLYKSSMQRARDRGEKARDCYVFCVSGRKNCAVLVHSLQGRLRSKKSAEFQVWADALAASVALGPGNHPDRTRTMQPYREALLRLRRR